MCCCDWLALASFVAVSLGCCGGMVMSYVVPVPDIDECEIGDNECVHIGQHCVNTEGSYYCTCVEGFEERDGYCHGKKRLTERLERGGSVRERPR